MKYSRLAALVLACLLTGYLVPNMAGAGQEVPVQIAVQSISANRDSGVQEVTTEELKKILKAKSALVLDTRPFLEWSISHIPGALNVAPKPGAPLALYTSDVAEIGRLVDGDKMQAVVLYCNGPFCGKSKRVAGELIKAGHTNVQRYQLGAPTWRALVGMMVIEPEGARYVFDKDQTAVWIDARDESEFQESTITGAKNVPESKVLPQKDAGEVFAAKNDGRLPMKDHNTRIIVFGKDGEQARKVANALVREAFHNVTYFKENYVALQTLLVNTN